MGIKSLRKAFEGSMRNVHVSDFKGQVVAIDVFAFLHRGATGGERAMRFVRYGETDLAVKFALRRVGMVLSNGLKPLLVFDGGSLPAKGETNEARQQKREESKQRGDDLYAQGDVEGAIKAYSAAVTITAETAAEVHRKAKEQWGDRVDFLVAPYEADAQLAHLARSGRCALVITEDSDLIPFGVPRILFGLDRTGAAKLLVVAEIFTAPRGQNVYKGHDYCMQGWDFEMLVLMCVLSGCDYVKLKNVGLAGAHNFVGRNREMPRVLRALARTSKLNVPADYAALLDRAVMTFGHQTVFDRALGMTCYLTPLSEAERARHAGALDFLGATLQPRVAVAIARGEIHPRTHEPFAAPAPAPRRVLQPPVSPILPRRRSRDEMEADEDDDDAYDEDDFWDEDDEDDDDTAPESFLRRKRRRAVFAAVVGASALALGTVVVRVGCALLP